jgi:hypothetical protein
MTITGPGKAALVISGTGSNFFNYTPDATSLARNQKFKLGGMTLDGGYIDIASTYAVKFVQSGGTWELNSMVIHDIDFYHCCRGIGIEGDFYGVGYNCSFTYRQTSPTMIFLQAIGNSRSSWENHPLNWNYPFGTSKQFFLEDCTFNGQVWSEAGHGGRYGLRHNTFSNQNYFQMFDFHGNQGDLYGTLLCEVYDNIIDTGTYDHSMELITYRGGCGLFYNNVVTGPGQVAYSYINMYDSEVDDLNATPMNPYHTMNPDVGYAWNNTGNGATLYFYEAYDDGDGFSPGNPTTGSCVRNGTYFDEYSGVYMGYTFTPGVLKGLRSARPASMASYNRVYWATDESKLYRWISPGTWELYYTPYTYPHPLRSE